MTELYTWIRNIVIYMILNTIIMNLVGNSSYKKYISIVSGLILVIIVISPVINYLKGEDKMDYYLEASEFSVNTSDFKNDLLHMEEEQSNAVFREYEDKIKKQAETLLLTHELNLVEFSLTFDRDTDSISFGTIKNMKIKAEYQDKKSNSQKRIRIDDIEITDTKAQEDTKNNASLKVPSYAEITIKNELSDFYNIEPGNINISIQGG